MRTLPPRSPSEQMACKSLQSWAAHGCDLLYKLMGFRLPGFLLVFRPARSAERIDWVMEAELVAVLHEFMLHCFLCYTVVVEGRLLGFLM